MMSDSPAPPVGETAFRLDEVFGRAAATSATPGAQAAVVRNGVLVWSGSYGLADVEAATPVVDQTVFCLASLGKTMVAALTLHLVDEGVLALDAPLASVVGKLIPGAEVVTVRMLLTHTAGYPDLYESPEVMALMPPQEGEVGGGSGYDPDRSFTWEMLAVAMREPVEPGVHWEYSNTGYILLGEVLTRALGGPEGVHQAWTSLAEAAGGKIRLTPDLLTMERAEVDPARLAHGYDLRTDGSFAYPYAEHHPAGVPTDLFGLPFADGLFAGTAVGTAVFLDALFVRRSLLDPATVDLLSTPTAQAAAADVPHPDYKTYAMGTFQMSAADAVWQGHRGRYGGFSTVGASRRVDGTTLVVLINCTSEDPPVLRIWRELAGTV
jgi:D-alanyl-D-alanine carboxypeptidase